MKHPITGQSATVVAALLAAVLLAAGGCGDGETSVADASATGEPVPEQHFFDYRFIETRDGVRQWILESDEMKKYPGQEDMELAPIQMDFFQEGVHFSVLTADSGRANLQTKNIHAWGNVVVVKETGDRLETEELYFNNETQLIYNEVFNRMTRDGDVVTGIGLEATPDLEYIRIKEQGESDVSDSSLQESDAQ